MPTTPVIVQPATRIAESGAAVCLIAPIMEMAARMERDHLREVVSVSCGGRSSSLGRRLVRACLL